MENAMAQQLEHDQRTLFVSGATGLIGSATLKELLSYRDPQLTVKAGAEMKSLYAPFAIMKN